MATNFNIKSMTEEGAVIRILANDKLVDCRFPSSMREDQRMGWLKQTANEVLRNMGHADKVVDVPIYLENAGTEEEPVMVEKFSLESYTQDLPEADPEALVTEEGVVENKLSWWDRVKGWLS